MINDIIYDNWGLPIAFFVLFVGVFETTNIASKILLILFSVFIIIMSFWKDWFVFKSVPTEDNNNTNNVVCENKIKK